VIVGHGSHISGKRNTVYHSPHPLRERQEGKMNSRKKDIQRLTLAAFFIAIEVILAFTPVGYIPVGALSITTLHLPVILAGVLIGPSFGAEMGFVFGLTSFVRATMSPTVTSFVFSPFVQVGTIQGNFWSLVICFGPRIMLGWLSGMMYRILVKHMHSVAAAGLTAAVNTVIHTLSVLGLIWLFFGEQYASALSLSMTALAAALVATITTNGILEAVLAAVAIPALVRVLTPAVERMGLTNGKKEMHSDRSDRRNCSI
jgi:uncharacterized membrane protein